MDPAGNSGPRHEGTPPEPQATGYSTLRRAATRLQSAFDERYGGFREAPKLPPSSAIEFLLRSCHAGMPKAGQMAELTLRRMALGGIYDQVGGGFHRLSTDIAWQVPRFEKLLAGNALLARAYTHGWQLLKQPLFQRVGLETLEYLLRDLADKGGAFHAGEAPDSDSEQDPEEGGFYTWSFEEFQAVAPEALEHYGVTPAGNLRGRNVLTAASQDPPGAARAALLKKRSERKRPLRDEKILTCWNGLAIGAFAEAGACFYRPDLIEAARRAAGWVLNHLRAPSTGRLFRMYPDMGRPAPGMLEDYAYLSEALYILWEVTLEPEWLVACEELSRQMLELCWDPARGGLNIAGADDPACSPKPDQPLDDPYPSPSAVAAGTLQKLGVLTGNAVYARHAEAIVHQGQEALQDAMSDAGSMLCALDLLVASPIEIAVLADPSDRRTLELLVQIWSRFLPEKVCAGSPAGINLPMLNGKQMLEGRPTVYVRRGEESRLPVTDAGELGRALTFWSSPPPEQVEKVTRLIQGNSVRRRFFFDKLQNPQWIEPLTAAGLFETPPHPIYDYAGGTVGSPPWPQSSYLARMAVFNPEAVQHAALKVPDVGNVLVHENLADAALAMPAALAAELVPNAIRWLKSPYQLHLPEKLGSLAVRLAEGGRVQEALRLAAALLELRPQEVARVKQPEWLAPEPAAGFARYDYEQILRKDIPRLAMAAPFPTVEMLCNLLDSAITLSHDPGAGERPRDHSHLWRPALEQHEQNMDKTLRDPLVTAMVETVEQVARQRPSSVPELVLRLESGGWHIFRRIALHLLRAWPEMSPELIRERLMDRHLFEDPHFHREYLLLGADHLMKLSEGDQHILLGWVDDGPDLQIWKSDPRVPQAAHVCRGGDAAAGYAKEWKLKRLAMLQEALPGQYRSRYRELAEELGPAEHPDLVRYLAARRADPTTPRQADELHASDLEELLGFLRSWKPSPGLGNPTVEGLARKLAAVVATEPVRFSGAAAGFRGLDPAYIWAIVRGLREATEGYSFAWRPVLELCGWAVTQNPAGTPARWRPALLEICRLLGRGFSQGQAQLPFNLRQPAWAVLEPLAGAPASGAPERKPDQPGDPGLRPESTVQAEAMDAVARYALWVSRHLAPATATGGRVSKGLGEMPEVRTLLEEHLDPDAHQAYWIRAVYGRWFSWLLMLDPGWARQHAGSIFPRDPSQEALRDAAWEGHISFSQPFDHLLEVMGSEYERAVARVGRSHGPARGSATAGSRLAEHLMVFYLRGRIPLDSRGLLGRFFRDAPDELRRHALAFAGRTLQAQEAAIPPQLAARLQVLWESRVNEAVRAGTVDGRRLELSAFGLWFASGRLETSWALAQLRRVVDLGVTLEAANLVVARLKDLQPAEPEQVVECLGMMLAADQDRADQVAWTDDARAILHSAMNSGDPARQSAAMDLLPLFDVARLDDLVRWR